MFLAENNWFKRVRQGQGLIWVECPTSHTKAIPFHPKRDHRAQDTQAWVPGRWMTEFGLGNVSPIKEKMRGSEAGRSLPRSLLRAWLL